MAGGRTDFVVGAGDLERAVALQKKKIVTVARHGAGADKLSVARSGDAVAGEISVATATLPTPGGASFAKRSPTACRESSTCGTKIGWPQVVRIPWAPGWRL